MMRAEATQLIMMYRPEDLLRAAREVAWLFAYKHGLRVIKTRRVPDDVLENWLVDNFALVESLDLRERAWRTFLGADIVVGVRDLQASLDTTPAYYVALEGVDSGRGQNRTLRPLSTFWPPVFAGEQDVGPPKG